MPQPAKTPIEPSKRCGSVPGVLQRLPAALEEVAVLRVHDRRVARAEPEELGVERSMSSSTPAALHVVGIAERLAGGTPAACELRRC